MPQRDLTGSESLLSCSPVLSHQSPDFQILGILGQSYLQEIRVAQGQKLSKSYGGNDNITLTIAKTHSLSRVVLSTLLIHRHWVPIDAANFHVICEKGQHANLWGHSHITSFHLKNESPNLGSELRLRYIEGVQKNSHFVFLWRRSVRTKEK